MSVSKNGQQPGPGIGTVEAVHGAERPDQGVLHQILGVRGLAGQRQRDAVEDGNPRYDVMVECQALLAVTSRLSHARGTRRRHPGLPSVAGILDEDRRVTGA